MSNIPWPMLPAWASRRILLQYGSTRQWLADVFGFCLFVIGFILILIAA